jgi:hypothetical protein
MPTSSRLSLTLVLFVALLTPTARRPAFAQEGGGGLAVGGGRGGTVFVSSSSPTPLPPLGVGTGAISGVVVNGATARPLADVIVSLRMDTKDASGRATSRSVSQQFTDAKGRFVFTDLPRSDSYTVATERASFLPGAYGASAGESSGSRIPLAEAEWFSRADVSMWPTGAISGRVLDERGDPIVGAYVRVLKQFFVAGSQHVAAGSPVTTDDRGAYRIAGLDPGRYFVCAPSVQSAVPSATILQSDSTIDGDAEHRLVVGRYPVPPSTTGSLTAYAATCYPDRSAFPLEIRFGGERSGVDLRMTPLATFSVSGRVNSPPEGLLGLTLRLIAAGTEELGQGSETATALVGFDGTFTFLAVPPGSYVIDVRTSLTEYTFAPAPSAFARVLPPAPMGGGAGFGWQSTDVPSVPRLSILRAGSDTTNLVWGQTPVTVDGADVTGVVVTLRPAVGVSGRVIFDGVSPKPTFPIIVTAEPSQGDPSRVRASKGSDAPGTFAISGLTPGDYFLRVRSLGEIWVVKSVVVNGRDYMRIPFDVSGTQDVSDVTLTFTDKPTTLTGSVRTAQGSTAASAFVLLFPADADRWRSYGLTPDWIKTTRANSNGTYRLSGTPAGDYYVVSLDEAQGRGWQGDPAFLEAAARVGTRVSLTWGETKTVDLRRITLP